MNRNTIVKKTRTKPGAAPRLRTQQYLNPIFVIPVHPAAFAEVNGPKSGGCRNPFFILNRISYSPFTFHISLFILPPSALSLQPIFLTLNLEPGTFFSAFSLRSSAYLLQSFFHHPPFFLTIGRRKNYNWTYIKLAIRRD